MLSEEFLKSNNIAIYVHGNELTKEFVVNRTGISIESECLFEQLIVNSNYDIINEYLEDALLPRIWSQGNSKCIITKVNNEIIALFYDSNLSIKDHYFWVKDIDSRLHKLCSNNKKSLEAT